MSPDFEAVIRKRGDRYVLAAPDYGVVLSSSDPSVGMKELEARVAAVTAEFREAGIEHVRALPQAREAAIAPQVLPFLIKTAVACVAVAVFFLWASLPLANAMIGLRYAVKESIDNAIEKLPWIGSVDATGRAGVGLIVRLGDAVEQVTPERKEELRVAVRKIVRGLAPVLDEVRPALDSPGAGAAERRP